MINTLWTLFFVMTDKDERFVFTLAEGVDDVLGQLAVVIVKSVQGLVKYQQLRVFHKGPCQKHKALFPARHFHE